MKKYFKTENDKKSGKWSDGFSNSKTGKPDKKNKPKQNDGIEFDEGAIVLIDEVAECESMIGSPLIFAVMGGSLKVNGKKIV